MANRPISVWRGDQFLAQVKRRGFAGLFKVGHLHRNEMIRLITRGPKSGRQYSRGRKVHTASAPGQPPASDTGRLVQSIRVQPDRMNLRVVIQIGAAYARLLERGTKRMRPRPFVQVAADNIRARADGIMAEALTV
jgi:HK97 gp10 family phage protein